MTKDEFASYLTEKGYPADNINGIVLISKEKPLSKEDEKEVIRIIHETGYNKSFGYLLCSQFSRRN